MRVAHAPYDACHTEDAGAFWQDMLRLLRQPGLAGPQLVLADANAHLGSVVSSAVGGHWPEDENSAGAHFHDFLLALDLTVPCTFAEHHVGSSHTWQGPWGTRHRLDYVAVPSSRLEACTTQVLDDFEALQRKEDHFPTMLLCQL